VQKWIVSTVKFDGSLVELSEKIVNCNNNSHLCE